METKGLRYEHLTNPCKNFCFLASTTLIDPKDGRQKIVLSSFVSRGTGGVIFIDPKAETAEWLELPGDEGAWALLPLNNEKLLVGTCGEKGYLHCLELKNRKWAKSLREEKETYIWNLILGNDGMIYGGTYPGCVLLQYNPREHILMNMGRMSKNPNNLYSRALWSLRNYLFINCGIENPHITLWDIEKGISKLFGKEKSQIKEIGFNYICTETEGKLDYYDNETFEPISQDKINPDLEQGKISEKEFFSKNSIHMVTEFKKDKLFGIRGQEYTIINRNNLPIETLKLNKMPVDAPATGILTVTADSKNRIWGSSNFGQTIFCYDPKNDSYFNTPSVCNRNGEVYGIRAINDKIFMTCYAGGDHVVYDPSRPWDQINNVNPKTLKSLYPDLIRPETKSVIGPDGALWTGWMAKYGVYGGGVSRVDPKTEEVKVWKDLIPEQGLGSIASGKSNLYFTTTGKGNGLPEKDEPLFLGVLNTKGELLYKKEYPKGRRLGLIETVGNLGLLNLDDEIIIFDCSTMEFLKTIKTKTPCTGIVRYTKDRAVLFCDHSLYMLMPKEGSLKYLLDLPGRISSATFDYSLTNLYFAYKTGLYRVVLQ